MLASNITVKRANHDLTLEEAQELITHSVLTRGSRSIPSWSALGSILRQDILSDIDYPNADVSTRDGYCLQASATSEASPEAPVRLRPIGLIRAGKVPAFNLAGKQCARIMTGAVLPEGADSIVQTEDVTVEDGRIIISTPVMPGRFVKTAGQIVTKGERVLEAGRLITPAAVGLLAEFGIDAVAVSEELLVGVLATGDEVVPHSTYPLKGFVRDSNARMLIALLDDMWLPVIDAEISRDLCLDIHLHIKNCTDCDAIIIAGGTGTGERDLVGHCLKDMGANPVKIHLRMKPGRRMVFGRLGRQEVFCLPGNPVACFVLFHLMVKPALLAMMGSCQPLPIPIKGRWAATTRDVSGIRTFMPSRLMPDLGVEPLTSTGLGDMVGLAQANCLVSIPEGTERVKYDQVVDVYPIGSVPWTGV
jgi:molybdopterin molybdotransferase